MIGQNKKSVKLRMAILIAIYTVLIPFSFAWYNALVNVDCSLTKPVSSDLVKIEPSDQKTQ
ncbi:MAG: hypothetical protein KGI08_02640, partial [Thaumarchaeota archaeon]|nr:hypothetical protein [Nitrososphaerota archaeon]